MTDAIVDDLQEQKRRGLIKVLLHLCRGNYQTSLRALRMENPLPMLQSHVLESILLRLMKPKRGEEMEPEFVAKMENTSDLVEKLNNQGVDTTMPEELLFHVYQQALNLNFKEFRDYLAEVQFMDHSKLDNALMLNTYARKLAIVKRHIKKLHLSVWFRIDTKLFIIYGLIVLFAATLVVQLR